MKMKKKVVLMFLCVMGFFFAQGQGVSNIGGVLDGASYKKVTLCKVLNGRLIEIAVSVPDEKGRFAFRFTPEYEGLYTLGEGTVFGWQGIYRFYFKGGDDLNLKLTADGYELIGTNSKENQALSNWDLQSKTLRQKGTMPGSTSTYVDFFPEVESFKGQVASIGRSANTGNTNFDSFFSTLVDFDFAYYCTSYLFMPRSKHPEKADMSAYYRSLNADHYLTKTLLNFPYGDRFLSNLVVFKLDPTQRPTMEDQVNVIPIDELRGQYVLQHLERAQSYNNFQDLYDKFKVYFISEDQQNRAAAVGPKLMDTKIGAQVVKFAYPDIDGKKIALDDLKGKVVVIDLWATWCGPCREEEPFWEKLNEEFKDREVAFVGISVDKDKSKWETYMKRKHMKGLQIYAGEGDVLSKAYKVTGIPRYILIDKKGNLISADSPRPSNPKLKSLLEEWLTK